MVRVTIILNEASGGATAARRGIVEDACARAGLQAGVLRVGRRGVLEAAEHGAAVSDVLVAAGGDGTVSSVAAVAVRTGVTFGVIPLGTLNHFARDAGIPRNLDAAVAVIAAGRTTLLDVGDVNGAIFLNNASLGIYPRFVWERHIEEAHGHGRWTAFAIALARSWRAYRTVDVQLTVDGRPFTRQTPFVFIGNGDYRVEGLELGSRASLQAGRLSLFVAPGCDRLQALALPFRALVRRLSPDGTFEAFAAREISIEMARPEIGVALDGEIMLAPPPLRFSMRARALRTLVPEGR